MYNDIQGDNIVFNIYIYIFLSCFVFSNINPRCVDIVDNFFSRVYTDCVKNQNQNKNKNIIKEEEKKEKVDFEMEQELNQ